MFKKRTEKIYEFDCRWFLQGPAHCTYLRFLRILNKKKGCSAVECPNCRNYACFCELKCSSRFASFPTVMRTSLPRVGFRVIMCFSCQELAATVDLVISRISLCHAHSLLVLWTYFCRTMLYPNHHLRLWINSSFHVRHRGKMSSNG